MTYYKWSKTAASNATADSTINWAEGQAPSSVNDSARAVMAAAAKERDDRYGLTTAGSSTAYTATTNQVFAALTDLNNVILCIIPHTTSGAAPTLNVDSLGAKAINVSTGVAIATGALLAGSPYLVKYVNASTEFILLDQVGALGPTSFTSIKTGDGTVSLPAQSFTSDTDSAAYGIGANNIGYAVNGAKVLDIATTGLGVTGVITATTSITATTALSGATAAGSMLATQAEQETGSATDKLITPGRQHFHISAAKGWMNFNGSGTPAPASPSYNFTSVTDNGVGDYTLNITTAFSTAVYARFGIPSTKADGSSTIMGMDRNGAGSLVSASASAFRVNTYTIGGTLSDMVENFVAVFGDQA